MTKIITQSQLRRHNTKLESLVKTKVSRTQQHLEKEERWQRVQDECNDDYEVDDDCWTMKKPDSNRTDEPFSLDVLLYNETNTAKIDHCWIS